MWRNTLPRTQRSRGHETRGLDLRAQQRVLPAGAPHWNGQWFPTEQPAEEPRRHDARLGRDRERRAVTRRRRGPRRKGVVEKRKTVRAVILTEKEAHACVRACRRGHTCDATLDVIRCSFERMSPICGGVIAVIAPAIAPR